MQDANSIAETVSINEIKKEYKKAIITCSPEDIVEIYDISYVIGDSNKVVNYQCYTGEEILIDNQNYYYSYNIRWLKVVDSSGFDLGYVDDRYIDFKD